MDQSLKQRLLGVVIFTALAAIFIPMLFDDPVEESEQSITRIMVPPAPIAAYEEEIEAAPENAEDVLVMQEADYIMAEDELDEINTQPIEENDLVELDSAAGSQVEVVEDQAEIIPSARPSASQRDISPAPKLERWFIQAASLSTKSGAEALRDDLIKQGYNAFYDAYRRSDNKLFYRVRVGPELDKQKALQMQKKIDKNNFVESALMKE